MAKKSEIAKMILGLVAVLGTVTILATFPGLAVALSPFIKNSQGIYSPRQIKRSLDNLKKQGLISMRYEGDKIVIELTKNGKYKLLKFNLENLRVNKQKKWDKKWRLIIFDIPEKFKTARHMFRRKLQELGFQWLQKSVWVCPYPCEDEIDFLKEIYLIRPYVRIVLAESIDIQTDLKKKFNI